MYCRVADRGVSFEFCIRKAKGRRYHNGCPSF
nr:MAG TPA: hypothetical protein [Caudoviricetes sp.]